MNEFIIEEIAKELGVAIKQVETVLKLLEEGNTIPFIARYRKDVTGNLDEEEIKKISDRYNYELNLLERKEDVIRLIDEKGMLTDEIKQSLLNASKLTEIEDIYRPFKEKKKTKATEAIKLGLEPLAKKIMAFPTSGSIEQLASGYNMEVDKAIENAGYIIAEWISDNASTRKYIRNYIYNNGNIVTKLKDEEKDENHTFKMYYEFQERIKYAKHFHVLAINRAEDKKIIKVDLDYNEDEIQKNLENRYIKNKDSFVSSYVKEFIKDSLKRLILPSIEREIRSDLKEKADDVAIENFGKNLESLLLQPPIKDSIVLAFDPGYVNGCKLAVIDKTGKYLYSTVIKPFASSASYLEDSKKILLNLINKYNIDIIAIGNGTASRESEELCAKLIKDNNLKCKYIIVSEAGASIYSTEKVASDEFPDLSPNERSAVSIGRRIQDPLAELVKIPPDGIGVGLYQHDVASNKLKDRLDFVVSKAVNSVGVNVNTASPSLLSYVSGFTKKTIEKIIEYRNSKGKINSRIELEKNKVLTPKTYEQAIGFLRIQGGDNILDATAIHPESYDIAIKLLDKLGFSIKDIGTSELAIALDKVNIDEYINILNTDKYTLEDVILSLKKPNRDPRDEYPQPILKSDVLDVKDLKIGMKLQGTVRNVVDFGAFIDIGLHNDGLVHISKITNSYIKHPSDILSVGDIVDCYVIDIKDNGKVSLSLIKE